MSYYQDQGTGGYRWAPLSSCFRYGTGGCQGHGEIKLSERPLAFTKTAQPGANPHCPPVRLHPDRDTGASVDLGPAGLPALMDSNKAQGAYSRQMA